ncbi:MAG: hypothetical protein H7338_24345, partial [Candidatus Sericytochromatia bacterium]|nr:hypothetical protein [Candidatus Sericytochromatia bacterium]
MLGRRHLLGFIAALAIGCQVIPTADTGGELSMKVQWPLRVQAIPDGTAVVAVAVFRDGTLVERQPFKVGIISRGSGSLVYGNLSNGNYRVVAAAFDKDLNPLAAGQGTGTVDTRQSPRTQVRVDLSAAAAGTAGDLSPYYEEIRRFLGPATTPVLPSTLPSTLPSVAPSPVQPIVTPGTPPPPGAATPNPSATPPTTATTAP